MTLQQAYKQPLYIQIKQLLLRRITEGEWQEREPLPSEWDLAAQLDVSQGTVRKALTELVAEGLLYREQGRGTFVAQVSSDWGDDPLLTPGLFKDLSDDLVYEFLGISRANASEDVAAALQLRRSAPLLRVRQLWRWQGVPVAVDDALLSAEQFDGLEASWLRGSAGVYATLLRRFGVRVRMQCQQFRAVMLPREESALLGVTGMVADVPALSVLRLSVAVDGQPVEWRHRYCLSHKFAITIVK
ncbi:GntR family transcriptional regulator [Neisseriaceae bacterium TC5R-5]|nr:GntR family transcriptional regulator [Neisseriaceae bacterium TC5R-5]